MKSLYIFALTLISASLSAQNVDVAGSSPTSGNIKDFYYDSVDDLLYGIGSVSNAGGETVYGVVSWDGVDWTAKGDQSQLGGPIIGADNPNSIMRNGDTLYAMGVAMLHPENYQMVFLMYWDESISNWKNKSYGIFGNEYQLVSYSDTLFVVGNISGGLGMSEDVNAYNSLGQMAYWTGSRWEKYSNPSFSQNPVGAEVLNGALYVDDYKYENGVWTNIGPIEGVVSMGLWGDKIVYGTEEFGGSYFIKEYNGTAVTTIGTSDARITGVSEYGLNLAVCGLGVGDINGETVKKIGAFDGTTWSTLFPDFVGGTGVYKVGKYHNQLIASAEDGGYWNTESTPFSLGSIVLFGGNLVLGSTELESNKSLHVYPNPTQSTIHIESDKDIQKVELYNSHQRLIDETNGIESLDLSGLDLGVYYLHVTTSNGTGVKKVIKQ